jgi:hypothetical protein
MSRYKQSYIASIEKTLRESFENLLQELQGSKVSGLDLKQRHPMYEHLEDDEQFVEINAMNLRMCIESMTGALKEVKRVAK